MISHFETLIIMHKTSEVTNSGIKYAKQKHLGCKKVRGQSEATMVI